MPFDPQGNFTRVMNWQEDAANAVPIVASRHDDEDDNFAQGFNETLCRDGRAAMTGALKMGNFKITGLGNGTTANDAVNKSQLDGAVAVKQNTITGGASSITSSNLTVNRALISNGSGKVEVSDTTNTELGYVHGVTSAIQTQIDSKQATVTGAATTITGSNLTTNRALTSNGDGKVAVSTTTSTELGYVHGVTSAIQTQINNLQTAINTAVSTALSNVYPVGSIYIGTQSTCPMASLITGSTWTLVSSGRALWTGNGSNANTTIEPGLPNITGTVASSWSNDTNTTGAFKNKGQDTSENWGGDSGWHNARWSDFNASRSSSIYGNSSTVQPPAYVVNVWRRTA